MILRYQQFIQRLNNIQKVCRLHNMTSGSLDLGRGLASTLAWRLEVALGYEILTWESDLPTPSLYLPIPTGTAHEKTRLLAQCYPSQSGRGWSDDDAILGLMRVRGAQCRARYAEAN